MDDCKFRCEVSPKVSKIDTYLDLLENQNRERIKILRLHQFLEESFA